MRPRFTRQITAAATRRKTKESKRDAGQQERNEKKNRSITEIELIKSLNWVYILSQCICFVHKRYIVLFRVRWGHGRGFFFCSNYFGPACIVRTKMLDCREYVWVLLWCDVSPPAARCTMSEACFFRPFLTALEEFGKCDGQKPPTTNPTSSSVVDAENEIFKLFFRS